VVFVPLAGCALINAVGFVVSAIAQTDLLYDVLGAASHIGPVLFATMLGPHGTQRTRVAGAAIALWAMRLGAHLFLRILRAGKDRRFDEIKKSPRRFAIAWTLQAMWAAINMSPFLALAYNSEVAAVANAQAGLGVSSDTRDAAPAATAVTTLSDVLPLLASPAWSAAAVIVWVCGFALEAVADAQKAAHANSLSDAHRWISTGAIR